MSENGARPCLLDDAAKLQQALAELTGADLDPAALERAVEACGPARDGKARRSRADAGVGSLALFAIARNSRMPVRGSGLGIRADTESRSPITSEH